MNNSELECLLKEARVPERSGDFWEHFPRRVALRLRREPAAQPAEPVRWFPRLAWGLAVGAACVLAGFVAGHWRGQSDAAANGLLQNQKFLTETLAAFPNQIRAIVQDERGLSLVLSEHDDIPASAPIYVQLRRQKMLVAGDL